MAKIRGIKPETWTDDKFVQLSPLARLLFIGMWNLACDNGHVEDNAVQLKIRLLPMDSCKIPALVDEMVSTGQVERHDGYLKVIKLAEHQHIDMRWLSICEWCEHDAHTVYESAQKKPRKTSAPSALVGQPASTPRVLDADGDGEVDLKVSGVSAVAEATFDDFWTIYPRKEGKGAAKKAWSKALKSKAADELLPIVRSFSVRVHGTEQRFIPFPATWLNQERWADEVDNQKAEAAGTVTGHFQPFTMPICPDEIAEDPEAYESWAEGRRQAWRNGERW